jgi:hypothetical protein
MLTDKINEYFKLPIFFNQHKVKINENIIKDLELVESIDISSNSIYTYCFDNDNILSINLNKQVSDYYTTDIDFLKEYQTLLKNYKFNEVKYTDYSKNYKNILDIWNELKSVSTGFFEKYYLIEWDCLQFLNRSEWFLQILSLFNMLSPILSLLIPIIILIIPFFIIKIKGLEITINEYINILKLVANQNAIGKLFVVDFNEINLQEKFYILVSAAFYLFSIYQNFMVCIRFNNNMKQIHNYFNEIHIYIDYTIKSMENYIVSSETLINDAHIKFNNILKDKLVQLQKLQNKIEKISDYNMFNFSKVSEVGYVLKCFYELHMDDIYNEAILYSLGFNSYIDCLKGLQNNLLDGKINIASFVAEKKQTIFEDSYYPCLKYSNPVKNTIKLNKNIIITGPNASGKTTVLKTTLINILFTQQFGCGFYKNAYLKPFQHIHCYLNIPDTSGRDSLFQAEARRCKEMLDCIKCSSKDETHFCAFDELYSGTNPEEAEQSATSFMKYITKHKNVSCILTTHFIKVCKKLNEQKNIANYKMLTINEDNCLKYEYKLERGISNVKGGILVLKQLNYPDEIVKTFL